MNYFVANQFLCLEFLPKKIYIKFELALYWKRQISIKFLKFSNDNEIKMNGFTSK